MTLIEGQQVKLAADLRVTGAVTVAGDSPTEAGAIAGYLSLAAGTEGTVERVNEDQPQSQEVREYVRLKSLLDDFGHQMPPGSRKQLEEQVGSLEPAWTAYQEQKLRVTVRVRFDNGFVLDDAREDVFTSA
ncbi:hypothetical protein MTF65_04320 [Streptomyces sp. APSN-46.1]|uniref:hypothetical protein n=1 Tax=Streptomyces sp. APSN-46.1 TaxID=2929049 RepID=UPI001FB4789F|nr:hypothetical protein [Streptomyces sp. APSN-46.1]MCJ1676587.1 hypothetical protein [Streptomyces sp. APSN-46.1]